MGPRFVTVIATVALLCASVSEPVAATNESVEVEQVAEACEQCDPPKNWNGIAAVCGHWLKDGLTTNYFFRGTGGSKTDFKMCRCCGQGPEIFAATPFKSLTTISASPHAAGCSAKSSEMESTKAWYWSTSMSCSSKK